MSVAHLEQPQLDDTLFGRAVERNRFGFSNLGGAMKDLGGSRPLELDEIVTFRITGRVVELGAGQSKESSERVIRYHVVDALECELEPAE